MAMGLKKFGLKCCLMRKKSVTEQEKEEKISASLTFNFKGSLGPLLFILLILTVKEFFFILVLDSLFCYDKFFLSLFPPSLFFYEAHQIVSGLDLCRKQQTKCLNYDKFKKKG